MKNGKVPVHINSVPNSTVSGHITHEDLRAALLELLADPEMARTIHRYCDVDTADNAMHHTLGALAHQAKSGL